MRINEKKTRARKKLVCNSLCIPFDLNPNTIYSFAIKLEYEKNV